MALEDSPDLPRRVLIAGVFDMKNYGDLLFPLMAAFRLREAGIEVVPVSPTGVSTGLAGAMDGISAAEMLAGDMPADAVLLGGGYIIHNRRLDFLEEYQAGDVADWAGPALWLGATLSAAVRDVPVLWNAPGAPHPFAAAHRPILDAAFRAADHLAVRDRGSVELLAPPRDVRMQVVPDPIADLARMWPKCELEPHWARLLQRKQVGPGRRFLALHLRNRSLAELGAGGVAGLIDTFAASHGLHPILVAVGRSHDDDVLAREVSAAMTVEHLLLDDPESLMEIAAAFAHASLYVGASLHGYVTAAAYGVPAVLVAKPSYRKFAGFLEHTGRLDDLARDWIDAFGLADRRLREPVPEMMPGRVLAALDDHWRAIAAAVGRPDTRRAARLAFLRAYLERGLEVRGPSWASAPFQSQATARPIPRAASARAAQ